MATKQKNVLEFVAQESAPKKVDRENGIIPGVKILGLASKNGQKYLPDAIKAAAKLYDGAHVFVAHPDRQRPEAERSPRDLFGWLQNPEARSDGLYGDLHYLKAHEMAGAVAELAERRPDKLGLSHNAVVQESMRGNEVVYESISRVRSVDLVCKPATTRGIFESEEIPMDETMAPVEGGGTTSVKDMIVAKVSEILGGDGDPASKAKAISDIVKELLKVEEKLEAKAEAAPAESKSEATVAESVKEKPDAGDRYAKAVDVLESAGCALTKARINLLAAYPDEAGMRQLVGTWPKDAKQVTDQAAGAKPRSGSVLESQREEAAQPKTTPYDDPKTAANLLRRR